MATTLQITDLPEHVVATLDRRAAEEGVTVSEYVGRLLVDHTAQTTASEAVTQVVELSRRAGFPVSEERAREVVHEVRV